MTDGGHKHLRRLDRVWRNPALYFITVCSRDRRPILTEDETVRVMQEEWAATRERHGWLVGRYVIMPDHVHFFCCERADGAERSLSRFMNQWKAWTSKRAGATSLWQRGFFDHLMRSDESYAEKWSYVRDNPVRMGLVKRAEEWPHSGFVDFDSPLEQ